MSQFIAVVLALAVGDPLPPGAVARLGSARLRHPDNVRDVAFDPTGTRLAVTSDDGRVSVWDAATGRLLGRADVGPYAGVAFGLNGVGTFAPEEGLRLFDPSTGKVTHPGGAKPNVDGKGVAPGRQPAPVLAPGLRAMAFQAGERGRCRVVVVDPATGREASALPLRHQGWETHIGFSPDGTRLAVGDAESFRSTIWVFDPSSGKVVFEQQVAGLYSAGVSLDRGGARVAASMMLHSGPAKPGVKVWDTATGKLLLDHPVDRLSFLCSALAPDGKSVAVLEGRTITLVDVDTAAVRRTFETRWLYGRLFFSPDGRTLAVASNRCAVELFDTATGRVVPGRDEAFDPYDMSGHTEGWMRFRSDGSVLAYLADEPGPSVWDPLTGRRVGSIPLPPGGRCVHGTTPDGRRVLYSAGPRAAVVGEFRLWDIETKADVATSTFPSVVGPRFVFTPDGRRLFLHPEFHTSFDPEWWEINPNTLARVGRVELKGGPFKHGYGPKFSADGMRRFELASDGTIRQWDVATGAEGARIRWAPAETLSDDPKRRGEVRYLRDMAVSGDGRWVGVMQFIGRRGEPTPDNRDPVTGADYLCLFDASDGRERVQFRVGGGDESGSSVALSTDGRLAAVYFGRGCRVFETATGMVRRRVGETRGGAHHVFTAAFSPDTRLLLTYSPATAGLVWDIRSPAAPFRGGLREAWELLGERSAEKAYPALAWLVERGDEAVRFVAGAVRPVTAPTPEQVAAWVKQLDADDFREREEAEARLRWVVGHHAARFGADLRAAIPAAPSPEVRRRLARAFDTAHPFEPLAAEGQVARAVEVLERIGTPAARAALGALADGPAEAWLTRDARAAVRRLGGGR